MADFGSSMSAQLSAKHGWVCCGSSQTLSMRATGATVLMKKRPCLVALV